MWSLGCPAGRCTIGPLTFHSGTPCTFSPSSPPTTQLVRLGGAAIQLAIFLLIPVAMYFLLIRPQRRRQREPGRVAVEHRGR